MASSETASPEIVVVRGKKYIRRASGKGLLHQSRTWLGEGELLSDTKLLK